MSWIKMRTNLPTDPRVVFVANQTKRGMAHVLGACAWLWMLADEHTTDGVIVGYTAEAIDRMVGIKGFCDAMTRTPGGPWLALEEAAIRIPDFERHNGETAKKRAQGASRASRFRNADSVTPALLPSRSERTNRAPRAEQSRARADKEQALPIADKSAEGGDACSMLAAAGLDHGAINAILDRPGVDECVVAWAAARLTKELADARNGKREQIDNPAGYLRSLVESARVPPSWRTKYMRMRMEKSARVLKLAGNDEDQVRRANA